MFNSPMKQSGSNNESDPVKPRNPVTLTFHLKFRPVPDESRRATRLGRNLKESAAFVGYFILSPSRRCDQEGNAAPRWKSSRESFVESVG